MRHCRHGMTGPFLVLLAGCLLIGQPSAAQQRLDERQAAVWILSQGGTIRLEGSREEIRSAIDLPRGPLSVREAVLTGTLVHPRDLERISALKGLRRLTLPGTMWNPVCCGTLGNVDDSDLIAALAGMESLESLHLSHHFMSVFKGIRVFDHAIEKITSLERLRFLQLRSTRVTGAHLDAFKNLERLDLTQTDVNDEGLANIARLPRLKTLRLRSTYVTDSGLAALCRPFRLGRVGPCRSGALRRRRRPPCRADWAENAEPARSQDLRCGAWAPQRNARAG